MDNSSPPHFSSLSTIKTNIQTKNNFQLNLQQNFNLNTSTSKSSLNFNSNDLDKLIGQLKLLSIDEYSINNIIKKLKKEAHTYDQIENYLNGEGLLDFVLNQFLGGGGNISKNKNSYYIMANNQNNKILSAQLKFANDHQRIILKCLDNHNLNNQANLDLFNAQLGPNGLYTNILRQAADFNLQNGFANVLPFPHYNN